jgi:molybdopterin/thiamine biosynthesis adenylyltransferase
MNQLRAALLACESANAAVDWKPLIFDAAAPSDERQILDLLRTGVVQSVHDTLVAQLDELIETREPGRDLSAQEIRDRVETHLGQVSPDQYGRWAYYPWSHKLVHVLPEGEFRELRTSRNRNKITAAEQDRLRELRIGVVGLSVGQASAIALAMEEIGGEFVLADFDALSLSNMNRIRAGVHDIGMPKAVLAAREIFEINPYACVRIFLDGVSDANLEPFLGDPRPLDLLVEECDDLYMKLRLRERARMLRIPVVMETSDRGLLDVELFDREPDRPLLHGRIGNVDAAQLKTLAPHERLPIVMQILGPESISRRLALSLSQIRVSLKTWPQLASGVSLGAALVADTARRIALGELSASGRYYVDLEELVASGAAPNGSMPTSRPAQHSTLTGSDRGY